MAAKKKARAKVVAKRPTKKTPAKGRKVAKKAVPTAKGAKSKALKPRKAPETLRLKSFTPSLTVSDLEKSIAFYTEALGFIISDRWKDGDVLRGVMLKAGVCELGISQDDWKQGRDRKKGQGFSIWCDSSQDLDVIASRVKAKGFALKEEPQDHPTWGVRSFSFDDPDGFHFTVARKL